jgi:hypothetical protein
MTDEEFFTTHKDRQSRIRLPSKILTKTKQRAMTYQEECELEFLQLGPHNRNRRRILVWRVPSDSPWFNPSKPPLLKIPFLLFADETVEDRDDVLLPMLHEIMMDARGKVYG